MAESFIGLPVDGIGKKLRSEELLVGAETVHQEVLTLAYANGDLVAGTLADGVLVNLGTNNDVIVTSGSIAITALPNEGQQTMANSISVAIASDQTLPLPTGAATAANQVTEIASLSVLDDWDETDRAKVNPIVGQAGVAAGAGIVGGSTQRVTLASDDPAVASLGIIDDWDESDRAKTNPIVGQAGVQGGSGAITANTQRVVIATDQPPIPVTGGGGGIQYTEGDTDATIVGTAIMWEDAGDTLRPVSAATPLPISAGSLPLPTGAATSANQATEIASLSVIDDWDESDRAKVNPIVGQAGVQAGSGVITTTTQRVVIATDQPAILVTGGGGGIQYTEGDTDSTITGTALMWEDAGDTLRSVSTVTPLPISAGSLPLPTGAATAANQATEIASLSVLDDWDESDRAKVNPIVGQAGVQGGSGAINALTQRVVIATDQPAIPVSGTVDTELTTADLDTGAGTDTRAVVGIIGSALGGGELIPGTAADGLLVNLGANNDVIVTQANITQIQGNSIEVGAGSVTTGTQRVTLGNDDPAVAALGIVDDWDENDRAKVNPIVGQAGVQGGSGVITALTQRVVIATDQPAIPVSGAGGVQYTEGDTDATITGTALMWEDAGDTLRPVSAGTPLPISGTVSGTVNIGTFPDNEPFNVAQWGGNAVTGGAGAVAAGTPRVTHASDDPAVVALQVIDDWDETDRAKVNLIVGQAGITAGAGAVAANTPRVTHASDDPVTTALQIMDDWDNAASDGASVSGDVAHDTADAGEPVKVGGVAVSGSASPTSVASGDRTRFIANQHGIPYHIAGHPNLITREYDFGASAQTDVNLAAAVVAADERVYVTRFEALNDVATTAAGVSVRAGFGTANVPTASATGVSGMIGTHPGLAPGSGIMCGTGAGVIAVGAAGEEPRLTSSAATAGNLHVLISYFVIDETP